MKYTILVVDDQQENIAAILNMLKSQDNNLRIIGAVNGKIACELAIKKHPDLILMDWEMPVMSGIDAVKYLKSLKETKDIPVIMVTALISSEHLQEALEAGAIDYVRKPIDKIELNARVNSALLLFDSYKEIKRQREDLRKLSIVASKTENSVIIMNSNGELEWANDGFFRMYEYSLLEFKKKFGDTILQASKNPKIHNTVNQCIETQESVNYVNEYLTKSGESKWIQTTLTPIIDDNNNIENLIAVESDITKIKQAEIEIKKEKDLSDALLLNILPKETAEELKEKGQATPRFYRRVSVLFTDFQGFTKVSENLSPNELVDELGKYFVKFDEIIEKYYIEKIKTIGDAYMCAAGLPIRNKSNPIDTVLAALEIQNFMNQLNKEKKAKNLPVWELRLGIHTGAVVSGVVGKKKFAYDIWGDSVNIASRMETACEVGKVNISETTYELVKDYFDCSYRGKIKAKNKGKIDMYFVTGIKPEFSVKANGIIPNKKFQQILAEI